MADVLAIALEAAESGLVRESMERGEMPHLARLAECSAWLAVAPDKYVGSVPLWPSFTTGLPAAEHRRLYGPWTWDPERMRIVPQALTPLEPLWAQAGVDSVGLFDVPGTRAEPRGGFTVRGWGTHNPMDRTFSVAPAEAEAMVGERHPFKCGREINYKTGNRVRELRRLGNGAMHGIGLRGRTAERLLRRFSPRLTIVNFPELHRTGHWLWDRKVEIRALYAEADRQVGRLVEAAGPETRVFVFSLNGMEATHGIPDFLRSTLIGTGFARLAALRPAPSGRRALAAVKARTPPRLKQAFYAVVPRDLALRIAELLPEYDWSATRAFAMPSEQHGWIRLNVAGREASGIVEPADFESTLDELVAILTSLESPAGEPLVDGVVRTGPDGAMPDLVVYWAPAAHGEVAHVDGQVFRAPKLVPWLTGQHTRTGFCLAPRAAGSPTEGTVRPTELQGLLLAAT
jgi:hypothetical protein